MEKEINKMILVFIAFPKSYSMVQQVKVTRNTRISSFIQFYCVQLEIKSSNVEIFHFYSERNYTKIYRIFSLFHTIKRITFFSRGSRKTAHSVYCFVESSACSNTYLFLQCD